MFKYLKKLHHQLLVWMMLQKKQSLFNNQINQIVGEKKLALNDLSLKRESFPKIAVIVLNHNNQDIISHCLDSLIEFNDYDYQIIVVDNQSTDNSVQFIKSKYKSRIKLLKNQVNGCASGRNLGAINTKAELLFFIDSDQGPTNHNWLNVFIKIMYYYPQVGAIASSGGFLTEPNFTGPSLNLFPHRGISPEYLFRTNIDYLETGGLMIKKAIFEQIDGFDEAFDPYTFEDADLSRKLIKEGYRLAYCSDLPIYHRAHSTTQSHLAQSKYLSQYAKNALYFKKKWLTKISG